MFPTFWRSVWSPGGGDGLCCEVRLEQANLRVWAFSQMSQWLWVDSVSAWPPTSGCIKWRPGSDLSTPFPECKRSLCFQPHALSLPPLAEPYADMMTGASGVRLLWWLPERANHVAQCKRYAFCLHCLPMRASSLRWAIPRQIRWNLIPRVIGPVQLPVPKCLLNRLLFKED